MQSVDSKLPTDDISVELSARRTGMSFQRTRLSADRTLMSVIRTSLSLISFGFTIYQVFQKLHESSALAGGTHAARNFGVALVLLGIGMLVLGIIYHVQFMLGLRDERKRMTEQGLIHGESRFPTSLTLITALSCWASVSWLSRAWSFTSGPSGSECPELPRRSLGKPPLTPAGSFVEAMESWLEEGAQIAGLTIEAMAVLIIAYASLEAFVGVLRVLAGKHTDAEKRGSYLRYLRWLVAGLTFQLAADIVHTVFATTWEQLGQVAVIAVIRTFLGYFLERDMSEADRKRSKRHWKHGSGKVMRGTESIRKHVD